jgi:hypothetical protein
MLSITRGVNEPRPSYFPELYTYDDGYELQPVHPRLYKIFICFLTRLFICRILILLGICPGDDYERRETNGDEI